MVSNITSLTGNGLKDWLIQRVTAVLIAAYTLFIVGYLLLHPALSYEQWHQLFQCNWLRIATVLVLLAFVLHAWVGIWTVTTDYLKGACLRVAVQLLVILFMLTLLIWGIDIIWGMSS